MGRVLRSCLYIQSLEITNYTRSNPFYYNHEERPFELKNSKRANRGVWYGVYEILLLSLRFLFVPSTSIINWAIKALNIHLRQTS